MEGKRVKNMAHEEVSAAAATNSDSNSLSFEVALERLQQTVRKLETGELSLEDSLKAFEEGVHLARHCQTQLGAAEQKVELLMSAAAQPEGGVVVQPFQVPSTPQGTSGGPRS